MISLTGLDTQAGLIPHHTIYRLIAESEYGQKLLKAARYGIYKPKNVSLPVWEQLLGPDVNNMRHMRWTSYLAQGHFRLCGRLNEEDAGFLIFLANTHDLPEVIRGDKNYDHKTADDEEAENTVYLHLLQECFVDIMNETVQAVMIEAKQVITDETHPLALEFNQIERMGYLITGIRAWRVSLTLPVGSILWRNLRALAVNVISNHANHLRSLQCPSVEHLIGRHHNQISEILGSFTTSSAVFDFFAEHRDKPEWWGQSIDKYVEAQKQWFSC